MEFQLLAEDKVSIQQSCVLQMLVYNIYSGDSLNCKEGNLKYNSATCIEFLHTH